MLKSLLFVFKRFSFTKICACCPPCSCRHEIVIATAVMCGVRNPACTAKERPRVGGHTSGGSIKKCL